MLASQGGGPELLIVHDRDDPEAPFESAVAISQTWQRSRLLATEGLGHRRSLRDKGVLAEVVAFLVQAADDARPILADRRTA